MLVYRVICFLVHELYYHDGITYTIKAWSNFVLTCYCSIIGNDTAGLTAQMYVAHKHGGDMYHEETNPWSFIYYRYCGIIIWEYLGCIDLLIIKLRIKQWLVQYYVHF